MTSTLGSGARDAAAASYSRQEMGKEENRSAIASEAISSATQGTQPEICTRWETRE